MKDLKLYENVSFHKSESQVRFLKMKHNKVMPHWHEHTELLYFYKADGMAYCDEKAFPITDGDLIIANSTEVHSAVSKENTEYYCMILSPEILNEVEVDGHIIKNHIKKDLIVKECFESIFREKSEDSFGSDMMIKSHVYRLLAHLYRNYGVVPDKEKNGDRKTKLARLNTVTEYIAEHYAEKIKVSDLAKLCFLSEEYFCRFFKNTTGYAVLEYLTACRMDKAAILLKNTDNSISEIAGMTGFDDANYFARVFKKIYGKTPSQYRKE